LLGEGGTAGTLNGLRVTNAFDAFLRRTNDRSRGAMDERA
jgi:hypothetical protein